ncbi:MAG: phosphopantetheine-binding protein [Acidobacteriota bacterium]|jgi:acyl carrier protein|nr:phosphopantetheine-binding protein [Acidobacteriota bacterium]
MQAQDDKQAFSPTEITVGEIWMETLQLDRIAPGDNFFAQGGDSLMTMMVLFRVSDILNVDMPPDALMDAPTLREFCKAIDRRKAAEDAPDMENVETGALPGGGAGVINER